VCNWEMRRICLVLDQQSAERDIGDSVRDKAPLGCETEIMFGLDLSGLIFSHTTLFNLSTEHYSSCTYQTQCQSEYNPRKRWPKSAMLRLHSTTSCARCGRSSHRSVLNSNTWVGPTAFPIHTTPSSTRILFGHRHSYLPLFSFSYSLDPVVMGGDARARRPTPMESSDALPVVRSPR
jgi:hypothetical protein